MCLILYTPKGSKFPLEYLDNIIDHNKDGFGMMWTEGKKVESIKGTYTSSEIRYMIKDGPEDQVAYHFRYCTRGDVSTKNSHPFEIHENLLMMHNGTLKMNIGDNMSDSYEFARLFSELDHHYAKDYFLSDPEKTGLEDMIGYGNKMLFMGFDKDHNRVVNTVGNWNLSETKKFLVSNIYSLKKIIPYSTYDHGYGYNYTKKRSYYNASDDFRWKTFMKKYG